MSRHRRRVRLGTLAVAAVLVGFGGCHRRLPELMEAGRVDEVIERAESSRFDPRRRAARAYAEALVQRGNTDKARSVLLHDFRRGGQIPSLVALADLERALGLDGVALLHYARVEHLDRRALRGREDVCSMFRQRARELLRLGEALAAEEDLFVVRRLCPADDRTAVALGDDALARAIDEAAHAQVRRRSQAARCPAEGCEQAPDSEREATIAATLERARAEGPRALRRAAARHRARLSPEDIVGLLLAEAKGELGLELLPDHEVRAWTAGARWPAFSSVVMARSPPEEAWLQLRLQVALDDMPVPPSPRAGPSLRTKWADRALELPGAQRWRISAYVADVTAAELALAADFRPMREASNEAQPRSSDPAASVRQGERVIDPPSHWAARVDPTPHSLEAMLVLARLRELAGQHDRALEIVRYVLARAHEAGIEAAPRLAAREAARQLARGRPWHALAIADSLPLTAMRPVLAAAASGVALESVFCEGRCPGDADFATVERVLGQAWVETMVAKVPALSRGSTSPSEDTSCPTLGERLGSDARGPVTEALHRAQQSLEGPGLGDALLLAVGSDLTLGCAAGQVLPIMVAGDAQLSAAALADILAQASPLRAAPMLQTHAELALVAGQGARAELLAIAAAAASRDPAATWAAIARRAHEADAREVERKALREAIMHTASLDHEPARHALVMTALRDLERSERLRTSDVAFEAVEEQVRSYLEAGAPSERWARREALARAVGRQPWSETVRPALVRAVLPTPELQAEHPIGLAWLRDQAPSSVLPYDGDAIELVRARGQGDRLPPVVDVFADPAAFEGARLQLAVRGRNWTLRRQAVIGLAVYGSAPARAAAVAELDRMIGDDTARRRALHELLLARPAALEPIALDGAEDVPRATVVVEDDDALLRVLFRLDPALAWFARAATRSQEGQ
mgnify:CR=1 FL=1